MVYKIWLYPERRESIKNLSYDDKWKILENIFMYEKNWEIPNKWYLEIIFSFMKNRFDIDKIAYETKCHKNKEVGKLGGRPKKTFKNRSVISETQTVISKPNSNSNSNSNSNINNKDIIYFENEILNKTFLSFLEMRKKINKYPTDHAINLLIKKINWLWPDKFKIECIEKSIMNNRVDIYLPKVEQKPIKPDYKIRQEQKYIPPQIPDDFILI